MTKLDEHLRGLGIYVIDPETRQRPSPGDLAALENIIQGQLPQVYAAFLSKYGGTAFEQDVIVPLQNSAPFGDDAAVERFYGFSTDDRDSILTLTDEVYRGRIPDEMLPFAEDGAGNLFLLGHREPVFDQVWFWDHEFMVYAGKVPHMRDDLEASGVDVSTLDDHALIRQWETLYPEKSAHPAGYNNLYKVTDTFLQFLLALQPDTDV
jgi:hypothetical protein